MIFNLLLYCDHVDYTLIQPIPSATEKAKIARMQIGAIHLIITVNNFSLLKVPSVTLTSSITTFGFNTKPTSTHVKNATIGIITLLLTKSNKSKNVRPFRNVMWLHTLNPREDGIPINKEKTATAPQHSMLSGKLTATLLHSTETGQQADLCLTLQCHMAQRRLLLQRLSRRQVILLQAGTQRLTVQALLMLTKLPLKTSRQQMVAL